MLIKRTVLDRILAGEVDTLFRKQKRPTVKAGGTLRTAIGVLHIDAVDPVDPALISAADAARAGAVDAAQVRAELARKPDGVVYRVRVRPGGTDPRLELRDRSDVTSRELDEIQSRLERFDRRSPRGAWTRRGSRFVRRAATNPA